MKRTSSQLKQLAREALVNRYSLPIASFVLTFVITMVVNSFLSSFYPANRYYLLSYLIASLITSLLLSILNVGPVTILLDMSRGGKGQLSDLFYAFRHQPDRIILTQLFISIVPSLIFLPACLFSILASIFVNPVFSVLAFICVFAGLPAVICFRLNYVLVTPLYIDCPEKSVRELLSESHALMRGNRLRYLRLLLSFLGILLLSVFACFIGLLWTIPYAQLTFLEFYRELVGEI